MVLFIYYVINGGSTFQISGSNRNASPRVVELLGLCLKF